MYPSLTNPAGMTPATVDQTTDQTQRRLVVKHQNQFLLLDLAGGMRAQNGAGLGLYVNDTRFLSQWDLTVGGQPLHFLTADADEGFAASLVYCNKAFGQGADFIAAGAIGIKRTIVVDEKEIVSESIALTNFLKYSVTVPVQVAFGSDFADMFEVRGNKRPERGYLLPARHSTRSRSITLRYLGQDNILRQTRIAFSGSGLTAVNDNAAQFLVKLEAQQTIALEARIYTAETAAERLPASLRRHNIKQGPVVNHGRRFEFSRAGKSNPLLRARLAYEQWGLHNARITSGNSDFNQLLARSYRDIYLLQQDTAHGKAVAAGVPWFAVPFGRDSLIAGLQTLAFMPQLSRDIVRFLAAYQGQKHDAETCEKPGRIMHELRPGEMAGLGEIPFRPYFGTVDATQLWLMLCSRYVQWTGDLAFAREMWPHVTAALDYLSQECGADLGYLTYGSSGALSNQGWKDSGNCIVYANGQLAKGPIAVCEAQGYLYAAWLEIAAVASKLGFNDLAAELLSKAKTFKANFNRDFWMAQHGTTALALDGDGKQCDVVASNAGHLLGTGILPREREKLVAKRLMQDDMFCGWGIRTLSAKAAAFHPTDYQVGAVWPHDNGMIASGMSAIGANSSAHTVIKSMLDVAVSQSDMRLPELFAGFTRGQEKQPVPYQVACIPQLWAAGCAFHMVTGMLGLNYEAASNTLNVTKPSLPAWLGHIYIEGLRVGASELNITFTSTAGGATTVQIQRVNGDIRCLVEY